LDRGGLAGAVGTEEAEHLAGCDGEGEVVDGGEAPESAGEAADRDRRVAGQGIPAHAAASTDSVPISSMKTSSMPGGITRPVASSIPASCSAATTSRRIASGARSPRASL